MAHRGRLYLLCFFSNKAFQTTTRGILPVHIHKWEMCRGRGLACTNPLNVPSWEKRHQVLLLSSRTLETRWPLTELKWDEVHMALQINWSSTTLLHMDQLIGQPKLPLILREPQSGKKLGFRHNITSCSESLDFRIHIPCETYEREKKHLTAIVIVV